MSSFYLDIIKDRLYTAKADSKERRAAQTTMYYILNALVKILTPMTCYTAEEIWKVMKHTKAEDVESPMLSSYPVPNEKQDNKELADKWEQIIKVKNIVSKELELARAEKVIGNSLDANMKMMPLMMSGMIIVMALFMPSALGIYWVTTNLFTVFQNLLVKRSKGKNGKA